MDEGESNELDRGYVELAVVQSNPYLLIFRMI